MEVKEVTKYKQYWRMTIDIVTAASSAWSRGQQLLRQMRGRKAQNKNTKKIWMIKMVVDDITCFED